MLQIKSKLKFNFYSFNKLINNQLNFSTNNGNTSTSSSSKKNITVKACKGKVDLIELGQPTNWTHPHLFNQTNLADQVTPYITKNEFEERRHNYVNHLVSYQKFFFTSKLSLSEKKQLMAAQNSKIIENAGFDLTSIDPNFIAIIPSCMKTFMAPDVMHQFKQNSDFLYLTGFKEPECVLVISRSDSDLKKNRSFKTALFVKEKSTKTELWDGPVTGPKMVHKLCGIEHAYPLEDLRIYLESLAKETNSNKRISVWRYPTEQLLKHESGPNCFNEKIECEIESFIQDHGETSTKIIDMNQQDPMNASHSASYFNSSRYFVQLCRVKKSEAELELMKRACDISSEAFVNSMKISHPFVNESLLYAKFDYDCRIRGSEYLAYIPVVAGGAQATVLHYIRNNQIIKNDQMVLMDAGCQYNDYASDITRTWPVSGTYKSAQRDLYEACLNVQKHCLGLCAPGISLQQLYFAMLRKLSEELSNLGLVDMEQHKRAIKPNDLPTDSIPMSHVQTLSKFCAHDIGHYLGLDVHDCPEISKHIQLEPNTVITVEPGIYIRSDDLSVPFKYRGIGIRIEDDVVITHDGHQVLSHKSPKEIDHIEKILMNKID